MPFGSHSGFAEVCRVSACGLALVVGASPAAVSAQVELGRPKTPPFEIIYGGRGAPSVRNQEEAATTDSGRTLSTRSNAVIRSRNDSSPLLSASGTASAKFSQEKQAKLSQIEQHAVRLISQSRDAWQRGLLDQASFAAWLDIAATAQLHVAQNRRDRARISQTFREQMSLWSEATLLLQNLGQPAARGLQADLVHARVMALRAEFQYRLSSGDSLSRQDQQGYEELANEHYNLRRQDYGQGLAAAQDVLAAARLLDEKLIMPERNESDDAGAAAVATFQMGRPVALRAAIEEMQRPGDRIPFPLADSVTRSPAEQTTLQNTASVVRFLEQPAGSRDAEAFLTQLDRDAQQITELQLSRYSAGTETSGSMLQSWWLHNVLAGNVLAGSVKQDEVKSVFQENQLQRLRQIRQIALETRDLRGRNAADVTASETLWAVRQLDSPEAH